MSKLGGFDLLEGSSKEAAPFDLLEGKDVKNEGPSIEAFGLSFIEGLNPMSLENMARSKAAFETGSNEVLMDIAKPEFGPTSSSMVEESSPEFQTIKKEESQRLQDIMEQSPVSSLGGTVASLPFTSPMDLLIPQENITKLVSKLKDYGATKAYKAMAPLKKFTKLHPEAKQAEIGKMLLDEKIISKLPKTKGQLLDTVEEHLDTAGEKLGETVDILHNFESKVLGIPSAEDMIISPIGAKVSSGKAGIDRDMILNSALDNVMPVMGVPGASNKLGKIAEAGAEFEVYNPRFIPIKKAEELRRQLGTNLKNNGVWKKLKSGRRDEISVTDELNLSLYDNLSKGILDASEYLAKFQGSPIKPADILSQKRKYSLLKDAQEILKDAVASSSANRSISLTDTIAGAAGMAAAAGSDMSTLAKMAIPPIIAGANKLGRTFGPQTVAKVSYELGGLFSKSPKELGKFAPFVSSLKSVPRALANEMVAAKLSDPEFAQVFQKAESDFGRLVSPEEKKLLLPEIKSKVRDPIKRAKMLTKLNKEGRLIFPEELE